MMEKQKHYFETVEWNRLNYNADQSFFNPKSSTHHFSHFDSPMPSSAAFPANHYVVGANNNRTILENKNSGRPENKTGSVIGPIYEKLSRLSESVANSNELNSKKRKAISRGKTKADGLISDKGNEDANVKRSKPTTESGVADQNGDETEKAKCNNNEKDVEPFKDYIHVRARRGQATDSHSLAERVRREKIGERMKLLQDLVPGCNKVTGKALMLDEIINYVESLQRQVEFLSMKLASVNPGQDENLNFSKDIFRQSANISPKMYPLDSSSAAFYNHQSQQSVQQLHNTQCFADSSPLNAHNLGVQLVSGDEFTENLPQFPVFGEDDLHRIVQMGWPESNQP